MLSCFFSFEKKLPSQRDEGDTQHVYSTWSKNVFELEIGAMVFAGERKTKGKWVVTSGVVRLLAV